MAAAAIEIGPILQDLAVIMVIAGAMAIISYRLKQPMVVGYIGAGMIIGLILHLLVLYLILTP
ncbi:MAG: hypothetical protein M3222_06105 [Thermoproteota archaeon]|nr:hypothetical protein [Thermoproteota archaeon]